MSINLKAGDRVKVKEEKSYLLSLVDEIGEVTKVVENPQYNGGGIAIVKFNDGSMKLLLSDIEPVEAETKTEPVREGVTPITKDGFDRLYMYSCMEINITPIMTTTIIFICYSISEKLFADGDTIEMTAEEFIAALWDLASPANVNAIINNGMDIDKLVRISTSVMTVLSDVIETLFGDVSEDD